MLGGDVVESGLADEDGLGCRACLGRTDPTCGVVVASKKSAARGRLPEGALVAWLRAAGGVVAGIEELAWSG